MYKITVFQTKSDDWNWHLAYNGKNMAGGLEGPGGFADKESAVENLKATVRVFLAIGDDLLKHATWSEGEIPIGTLETGVDVWLCIQGSN